MVGNPLSDLDSDNPTGLPDDRAFHGLDQFGVKCPINAACFLVAQTAMGTKPSTYLEQGCLWRVTDHPANNQGFSQVVYPADYHVLDDPPAQSVSVV